MRLGFYASRDDFLQLADFVSVKLRGRFLETYSEIDRELRRFADVADLKTWLCEPGDGPKQFCFCLEECLSLTTVKRIALRPSTGGRYRHAIEGWGLFQFLFEDAAHSPGRESSVSVNSRARAMKWKDSASAADPPEAWDWAAVARASGQIERYLRKRFVGRTADRAPVLPGAAATTPVEG